ncbi:SinR family protein [Paracoccus siganidrum]|uniref:SinR family protein n=1 Tax=Paracoccus siganidrum TaxID=1276757 RepID=A0A419A7V9_9RHOB|nr:SinR family protein [Paracoccus siganidrum]RJL18028.1 SinR family protein [Paracoccus siganidrum]RMC40984.1 SinR family protein [Paracoccus siganidrum]
MACYMIGYDLNREGANYSAKNQRLRERLEEMFPTYWRHLDSTWIVKTNLSAVKIRDAISPILDNNDELLVAALTGEAAWCGFTDKGSKWLKEHL